jgi:hypothetical protein
MKFRLVTDWFTSCHNSLRFRPNQMIFAVSLFETELPGSFLSHDAGHAR